jgi:hypothetical protein
MRMLLPVTRRPRGWLRLTACYLSILLVLSFICFEVLDLDGSDSPVLPETLSIKLTEPPNDRRTALASAQPSVGTTHPAADDHMSLLKPEEPHVIAPARVSVTSPRSRLTLPRAALDDPAA